MGRKKMTSNIVPLWGADQESAPTARQRGIAENLNALAIAWMLSLGERDELMRIATEVSLRARCPVFDEGEPAKNLFGVIRGAITMSRLTLDGYRQIVGFQYPGDLIGLADAAAYTCSAVALESAVLCRLPRLAFEAFAEGKPKFQRRLSEMASRDLVKAQNQILMLSRRTAKEKIAAFILMLSGTAPARGQPANTVRLPMNRSDIGDYLGISRETVSRVFSELKASGAIRFRSSAAVELADTGMLGALAGIASATGSLPIASVLHNFAASRS